ncbi:MAG TPA: iron-sulfur cluster assembly protein [Candidatus Limnocylindrales bacterium]|nr:iron-sulfur cluster assembly protein [Candidatus Limnocylindrales bacterium]
MAESEPSAPASATGGAAGGNGAQAGGEDLRNQVAEVLSTCRDPEIGLDIMSLGLVYDLALQDGRAHIKMTLTAIGCPWAQDLFDEVKQKVEQVPGITECTVELVYSPPWSVDMMSDDARMELGFL